MKKLKRKKSQSIIKKNNFVLSQIKKIKAEHPFWGIRRVWAYLNFRQNIKVNKKRVYRLLKENNLLVNKNTKLKAKRYSNRPKPVASEPNQFWGIDMTKIMISPFGWMYLVVVIDWFTKEIIGYSLNSQSKTDDWLNAVNSAVNNRFPRGIKEQKINVKLISDNGSQPTSMKFMKELSFLGIKQIFTTWNNPKGNADTERFMRNLKEDLVYPYDWDNTFDFQKTLKIWINNYNTDFPHQSLNYLTPNQMYQNYLCA